MNIYILSFYAVACGEYLTLGADSSEEKALAEMKEVFDDDEYITTEADHWPDDTRIYTNKGRYRIEVCPLDYGVSES